MRIEPDDVIGGQVVDYFDEIIMAVEDGDPEKEIFVTYHAKDAETPERDFPDSARRRTELSGFLDQYANDTEN